MRNLLLLAVLAVSLRGQANVAVSTGPPTVTHLIYDGSGNVTYSCTARQFIEQATQQKRSDSTLTNIAVATNVGTVTTASAHGAWIGMRVVVSGSTTAALNGTYKVLTIPSSTTYTITTSGVADATYNNAAMIIATNNPLLTSTVWSIQAYAVSSSQVSDIYWANASNATIFACSSYASY